MRLLNTTLPEGMPFPEMGWHGRVSPFERFETPHP